MATTILLRHGHSTGNADGILAGWTPGVVLTERGRAEAQALGTRLAAVPLARIVSSPLERCLATAEAVATGRDLSVIVEEDLGECRYGAWTGRRLAELAAEPLWRVVQDQPSRARFPDSADYPGESIPTLAHRVVAAIRRHDALVESEHGPSAVWVAVTHGDVIKLVVADAVGSHLDHFQRIQAGPASVTVVRYTEHRPFLLASNGSGEDVAALVTSAAGGDAASGDSVVGGDAG